MESYDEIYDKSSKVAQNIMQEQIDDIKKELTDEKKDLKKIKQEM